MAEYIDREELECDTEWSDYFDNYVSYSIITAVIL